VTRPRPLVPRDDPADRVRVVGEFGVIARVLAQAGTARAAQVGPGDDGAVLRTPDGRVVASTDVLVEGRHFRRDWSSAEDIGHKAAAANLADIAAMGATTTALLVGLACPGDTPTSWLEGVAAGLAEECEPLGAAVVGGDMVTAAADRSAVVLSVTRWETSPGAHRCCARAPGRGTSSRWPGGSGGRLPGSPCCGGGSAARWRPCRRTAGRPRPTPPARPRPSGERPRCAM
jgi:thiamine-monophosphate kinase